MNDPYDPQEPEGGRSRGTQYVSRKDIRLIGIVLLVLALVAWPVYLYMLAQVNLSICNKNVRKIGEALLSYVRDNDDRLPFAYERAGFDTTDIAIHNGYAYTWQWAIEPYATSGWAAFKCPAAEESEHNHSADPKTGTVQVSDYGMLDAYSGVVWSNIANPDQKVIIAETSNRGARNTYDPLPLQVNGVVLKDDGFQIGFNDNQVFPQKDTTDASTGKVIPGTRFATRLAFPNTSNGVFDHDSDCRHPDGINYLSAEGGLRHGDASTALVIQLGGGFGRWDVPKPLPRLSPKTQGP